MEIKEPAIAYGKQKMTIEEYLAFENASPEKHEYYRGEVFAMARAKVNHNKIVANTQITIGAFLKGKPCKTYNSDQRIHIEKNSLFTYPDISIICGEVITLNDDEMNALNPSVIIEVLSPSTRTYDRSYKFRSYRDIPTLKEYIILESESVGAEIAIFNQQGFWEVREYKATDAIPIQAIGMQLSLKDIYEGTTLIQSV
jgi:Uma2 family endonuclease